MTKKDNTKRVGAILFLGVLAEVLLESMLHYKMGFMWDDLWYATNLATGEPLAGIGDVWESQCWHFMNWGGRSVIHGLLQMIILGGELLADVLNMIMTVLLAYFISIVAGKRSLKYFCLAFFLVISFNPSIILTMFWQSGSVNYLYSSTWIVLFMFVFIRQVRQPDAKSITGCAVWMLPLGFITGWSNENMGPASFLLAVMAIFYFLRFLKKKVPVWMWIGAFSSLVGSVLVVCAPGNFVRGDLFERVSFGQMLYDKFVMMLTAGVDYLFPTVLFLLIFMLLFFKAGGRLEPYQIMLLITAVLAYGAMVLSPTFPNRASFGIMVICIILILSFLQGLERLWQDGNKYILGFAACMWVMGVYTLAIEITAPI